MTLRTPGRPDELLSTVAPALGARRIRVARAADGPAPTLVVDLTDLDVNLPRAAAVAVLAEWRRLAMVLDERLGPKTIGVLRCEGLVADLVFLQGLGDDVDLAAEVCLNSAACAVVVARQKWNLLPAGTITIRMGGVTFEMQEVA
jgi:hypothetical protein